MFAVYVFHVSRYIFFFISYIFRKGMYEFCKQGGWGVEIEFENFCPFNCRNENIVKSNMNMKINKFFMTLLV